MNIKERHENAYSQMKGFKRCIEPETVFGQIKQIRHGIDLDYEAWKR